MMTTSLDEDISPRRAMLWALRVLALACTAILLGLIWDISWHMTIGRDTFWTPAHIAMYFGGASSGLLAGALAIRTTFFAGPEEKNASIEILGGRAPFGVWIVIWGAIAMITSAPFDNWWHNAYGLDVKIISPPHVLLFSGMLSIVLGTLLLALREQNALSPTNLNANSGGHALTLDKTESRQTSRHDPNGAKLRTILVRLSTGNTSEIATTFRLNLAPFRHDPFSARALFPYAGGVVVNFISILFFSEGWPNHQHSTYYYYISCIVYPVILVAVARASRQRWAATGCAASYMGLTIAMLWILPRFSAHAKLGPVLNPVSHMVPPYFPHLLIVPALLIDVLKQRGALGLNWKQNWLAAAFIGAAFALIFGVVQYYFSEFLLSPAAHNAIFVGGQSVPYYSAHVDRAEVFWDTGDLTYLPHLAKILLASALSVRAGLAAGNWMRKVHR